MTLWKTTKIPEFYFSEIEKTLQISHKYVSVSEFIRSAIEEKLLNFKSNKDFLIVKDIVFNEVKIQQIHGIISSKFSADSNKLLNNSINKIIEESLDLDMISFLSKFLFYFAKYHPFEDGNKRTALVAIDAFLRLHNQKLKLKADKVKESEDEVFFWQNSNQQKSLVEIKKFLNKHIIEHKSTYNVDKEFEDAVSENKLLLEKLSR